jgi:hypothetical protein
MYILGAVLVLPVVIGNPIGLIGGFFAFKQYRKWQEEKELKQLREQCPDLFNG